MLLEWTYNSSNVKLSVVPAHTTPFLRSLSSPMLFPLPGTSFPLLSSFLCLTPAYPLKPLQEFFSGVPHAPPQLGYVLISVASTILCACLWYFLGRRRDAPCCMTLPRLAPSQEVDGWIELVSEKSWACSPQLLPPSVWEPALLEAHTLHSADTGSCRGCVVVQHC